MARKYSIAASFIALFVLPLTLQEPQALLAQAQELQSESTKGPSESATPQLIAGKLLLAMFEQAPECSMMKESPCETFLLGQSTFSNELDKNGGSALIGLELHDAGVNKISPEVISAFASGRKAHEMPMSAVELKKQVLKVFEMSGSCGEMDENATVHSGCLHDLEAIGAHKYAGTLKQQLEETVNSQVFSLYKQVTLADSLYQRQAHDTSSSGDGRRNQIMYAVIVGFFVLGAAVGFYFYLSPKIPYDAVNRYVHPFTGARGSVMGGGGKDDDDCGDAKTRKMPKLAPDVESADHGGAAEKLVNKKIVRLRELREQRAMSN